MRMKLEWFASDLDLVPKLKHSLLEKWLLTGGKGSNIRVLLEVCGVEG